MNTVNRVIALVFVSILGISQNVQGKAVDAPHQATSPTEQEVARYKVTEQVSGKTGYQARLKDGNVTAMFFGQTVIGVTEANHGGKKAVTNIFSEPVVVEETYDKSPYHLKHGETARGKISTIQKEDGKILHTAEAVVTASFVGGLKILTHDISYGDENRTKETLVEIYRGSSGLPMRSVWVKTVGGIATFRMNFIQLDENNNEMSE